MDNWASFPFFFGCFSVPAFCCPRDKHDLQGAAVDVHAKAAALSPNSP
jgi:hypothetical protein